jgi:hypothetical protein
VIARNFDALRIALESSKEIAACLNRKLVLSLLDEHDALRSEVRALRDLHVDTTAAVEYPFTRNQLADAIGECAREICNHYTDQVNNRPLRVGLKLMRDWIAARNRENGVVGDE